MDERSEYQKAMGGAAEDAMNERMKIKDTVASYQNSFVEYIKSHDIAAEVSEMKQREIEVEEDMRQEEEEKEKSLISKMMYKLKKVF